jgi:BirA family biotin operon repressor/biotin-[acetyl-CoA-carboxylase] ligase
MTDWTILSFDALGSTQDKAFEEARRRGAGGRIAITARAQTSGRGRRGNVWTSLDGNLFCSLLLRPRILVARAGEYSFLTAAALSETLTSLLPNTAVVQHKWPNDVWVNGKKIAGILLESESDADGNLTALVAGIGVNLAAAPEGACSVLSCGGEPPESEEFLKSLLAWFDALESVLQQEGFQAICGKWLARARGIGENIRVRLPLETFEGVFEGIDPNDGTLLVRLPDNTVRKVRSGEVFF